ncbi:MAG TPA: ABC transporter permease subunit [Acholeplasmataceae bacterium]|jgi:NitT/TauT family transport system permease protein|nr:ABC transporter permease subunit [Acholeplasmataceae bacterium]
MNKNSNNRYLLLGILTIIIVWSGCNLIINNSLVLPSIKEVLISLKDILLSGNTYLILIKTFLKLTLVIVISLVIALTLALFSFKTKVFESFIKPLLVVLKTIPVIAIIIFLLISFGRNLSPYIMTTLVVIPILYEGLLTSLKSISQELIDDIKTLSNTNWLVLKNFYFPLIINFIFMTIIQSFGLGLKVMIMGEFIAQPNGTIGYILQLERSALNSSAILAWSIILIMIVLLVEILMTKISKRKMIS